MAFLEILRKTFELFGEKETSAVRVLAYFLSCEAKDVHAEQLGFVELDFEGGHLETSDDGYYRNVSHELSWTFTSDECLREAHDVVFREDPKEDEGSGESVESL